MAATVVYHGYTTNTLGASGLFDLRIVQPGRIVGVRLYGLIQNDPATPSPFGYGDLALTLNGGSDDQAAVNDPLRNVLLACIAFASGGSQTSSIAEQFNSGYVAMSRPVRIGDRLLGNSSGSSPTTWRMYCDVYVMEGSA